MDEKSLHILEFDKVRHRLAGYTSFSAGEALALALVPTTDEAAAARWQAETAEALDLLDRRTDIRIGGARDVRPAVDNAARGFVLPADDLLAVRATIIAGRTLSRQLEKVADRYPRLADIAVLIEPCPGLVSAIGQALDERGDVVDEASARLATIRRDMQTTHGRIQERLQAVLNGPQNQYLQEPIITTRGGRYVVPLKADHRGRIKGVVHDQSSSGATLWIEPFNTVELNNRLRGLQIEEQEEIERILAELSARVADQGDSVKRVVERLAELDLIFARAGYAAATTAVAPTFVPWRTMDRPRRKSKKRGQDGATDAPRNYHPGSTLWLKGARHPLLDPATVVPTDLTLDDDIFLVLITGPNTGGKTVSLKTTGLMVLMAQAGLHLPVVEARLTVFDNVFADIGDEQSIEQSLSTFSGHITNTTHILQKANSGSLVLLDELGSGTDPTEGAALAQAIVSYLRDKGITTLTATHFPELKAYASQTPGATNASLLFDVDTLSPTYEMTIGLPGRSNAVAIARRLGLDETILDEAVALIGAGNQQAENMLDAIYDMRERTASEEAAARLASRRAEAAQAAVEARLADIDEERRRLLAETRAQAQAELEEIRAEIRRLRRQIRSGASSGLSLAELKRVSKAVSDVEETQLAPPTPATPTRRRRRDGFQVGDTVLVRALGTQGQILSLDKGTAEVAVGRLHMRADLDELTLKERAAPAEEAPAPASRGGSASPGMELDLRGQRVDEGLAALDQYLDRALLARLPWVRIIHGKGTGRLREAVRQALQRHPHVVRWEEGKEGEGDTGVTVAHFDDSPDAP